MDETSANSGDPTARKDEDDKMFSGYKERTEDKVIARETDGQGAGHLSCPGGLEGRLALLHYFHLSTSPHLLANQAELNILHYLS